MTIRATIRFRIGLSYKKIVTTKQTLVQTPNSYYNQRKIFFRSLLHVCLITQLLSCALILFKPVSEQATDNSGEEQHFIETEDKYLTEQHCRLLNLSSFFYLKVTRIVVQSTL
jgi:hypothetical protein